MQLLNYSFRDDALGHVVSPKRSGQRCANFAADLLECRACIGYDGSQTIEKMNHTWMAGVGHLVSRLGQALEINPSLVAQRVEFCRMNQCRRHVREILGLQR